MTRRKQVLPSVRHYFVDEAGDGTLFGRTGRVILGEEGCSLFFILGLLDVSDPQTLADDIERLRSRLLADPYFKNVPSMLPAAKKTARVFHATDDLPEVRREVFSLLLAHDGLRFLAVVRDKRRLLEYVRQRNERSHEYRYHPNELYDFMVRILFRPLLHKDDEYNICFASRGSSARTEALHAALRTAIWALQRLYERRDGRYVEFLWPRFRLVIDRDDTRHNRYGEYYTQKKPLTSAALESVPEDIGLHNRS